MTQVVTNSDNRQVQAYAPPEGGWLDGNDDIQPAFPMVTIMQPMSQVEGNAPGFFFHSDTGEITSNLLCVPLTRSRSRAVFTKGDEKPLCRSFDGVVPAPHQRLWQPPLLGAESVSLGKSDRRVPPVQPQNCASCPFSQWGGPLGDDPPACGESDLIIIARNGDPSDLAMLRIKGTSLKPYRDWLKKKVLPRRKPSYAFQLDLETEEHVKPGQKWYQLVVRAQDLSEAEAYEYHSVVQAFRDRIAKAVQEAGGDLEDWQDGEDLAFE